MKLKHFTPEEFDCKCGNCDRGFIDMDAELLTMLDKARGLAGRRFVINSGMRCKTHNRAVKGAKNSPHKIGHAVDIAVEDDYHRFEIVASLIAQGMPRLILYPSWIHADNHPAKRGRWLQLKQ